MKGNLYLDVMMYYGRYKKRLRGIVKQFFPYGLQRKYMWQTYRMTEPWDPRPGFSVVGCIRDILPYGLVRAWLKFRYEQKIVNARYRSGVPKRALWSTAARAAIRIRRFKLRPKVSVIVASYNYANYIGDTLDSILAQTYQNFELIVVDDGSEDESVELIERYVAKHPNVRLYMHEGGGNRGLPESIKLGISKATGTYVAFCESDDVWTPDYLEEKIALVNKYDGAPKIVINDILTFGDGSRCMAANHTISDRMEYLYKERNAISPALFRKKNWICTFSCCMVDRMALAACDFDSCPRASNLDWWLWRQVCCVNDVYVVHAKLTLWRMHSSYLVNEGMDALMRQREFIARMDKMLIEKYPEKTGDLRSITAERDRMTFVGGKLLVDGRESANPPMFSVVMATYNRSFCIRTAIDSLLHQSYQGFELIIVDDGSVDGTGELIKRDYAAEVASGKIRYTRIDNSGVCKARNVGLGLVRNEWIAYLDSDNEMCPFFLETFVREIVRQPTARNFYARLIRIKSRMNIGREFDLSALLRENFIDLGVYVHNRNLLDECGYFDENMTRFVDWELIVRQCKTSVPSFVDEILLLYNDSDEFNRITNAASQKRNLDYFRLKHCNWPIVTTVITAYNHEKYIKRAIESALMQKGEFVHEILVADDGSTDGTRAIIKDVMNIYPGHIIDISANENIGISGNLRKCFTMAKGDYVAVLEGDDYWISPWKLNRQVMFMREHKHCSMCFSRIKLLHPNNRFSTLPRHEGLKDELTGEDFIRDPNQNLIANFSCCLFRGEIVRAFPDVLYSTRFNEIACAFYIEKKGPIGFLPEIMSVYRLHDHGVWSASDRVKQIESAIKAREMALAVCAPQYRTRMRQIIDELAVQLSEMRDSG